MATWYARSFDEGLFGQPTLADEMLTLQLGLCVGICNRREARQPQEKPLTIHIQRDRRFQNAIDLRREAAIGAVQNLAWKNRHRCAAALCAAQDDA